MKVFLSYPSERLSYAKKIHEFVCKLGVTVWFDKESLIGGQNWDRERSLAQKEADLTILVCSPETIARAGVIQREVKEALAFLKDKPPGHIYLVLMRTEDIKLPPELDEYQYLDLFRVGWHFKLARSLDLKYSELRDRAPAALKAFIKTKANSDHIELKNIRDATTHFEMAADYFLFRKKGLFWDYINAEITADVLGNYFTSKSYGRQSLANGDRTGSWSLRVERYFSSTELVSLRFFNFTDLGGAHPSRGIYTKNYGGSTIGKLKLDEILVRDEKTIKFLKGYVELDVKRQLFDADSDVDFDLTPYMDANMEVSGRCFHSGVLIKTAC